MITAADMSDLAVGKHPSFIFSCLGMVQLLTKGGNGPGLVVATTRDAAKKVAATMEEQQGKRVSICELGTVQGATLARHIALAVIELGARGIFATDDGETFCFFLAPS